MSMRRHALRFLLIAGLGVGCFILYLSLTTPRLRISEETVKQLRLGMSEETIAELLGGPAGVPGPGRVKSTMIKASVEKEWNAGSRAIVVGFDAEGGATCWTCYESKESLMSKVTRWLRLS
jgi:hypothetical protein